MNRAFEYKLNIVASSRLRRDAVTIPLSALLTAMYNRLKSGDLAKSISSICALA